MVSPVVARSNLGLQIIILAVLLAGLLLNKRRKYFPHGSAMLAATVLNAFSFILVMGPSLFGLEEFIASYPFSRLSLIVLVHACFGSTAEILGGWVVVSWRLRSGTRFCVGKKKIMKITFILWILALSLGIFAYGYLYDALAI